jgi:hypothetical protein
MSGIVIPRDRTDKQPPTGYCLNPECQVDNQRYEFEVKHDRFACPKCGASKPPIVGLLVLTHWFVPAKNGPIEDGGGLRFKLACDDKRAYLATFTNLEAATKVLDLVNCPGCLKWDEDQRRKAGTFFRR